MYRARTDNDNNIKYIMTVSGVLAECECVVLVRDLCEFERDTHQADSRLHFFVVVLFLCRLTRIICCRQSCGRKNNPPPNVVVDHDLPLTCSNKLNYIVPCFPLFCLFSKSLFLLFLFFIFQIERSGISSIDGTIFRAFQRKRKQLQAQTQKEEKRVSHPRRRPRRKEVLIARCR